MEQLVILVIIALVSLVNWLMQKSAEKRKAKGERKVERQEAKRTSRRNIYTQGPPEPVPRGPAPAKGGKDPFQELMDALGLPSDEEPPEPSFFPEDAEFIPHGSEPEPPPLPEPPPVAAWKPPAAPRRPDRKTMQLASAFAAGEDPGEAPYRGQTLRALLAGRDMQRKAVVLAEILGTPRGLAPKEALMTQGHL